MIFGLARTSNCGGASWRGSVCRYGVSLIALCVSCGNGEAEGCICPVVQPECSTPVIPELAIAHVLEPVTSTYCPHNVQDPS